MATSGANTLDLQSAFSSDDYLASLIYGKWVEWKSAKALAEDRWTETKKYVFATTSRDTTNSQNPWDNAGHRPILHSIYSGLLVNIDHANFPHRDWLEFYGFDDEAASASKRQVALGYINTKHKLSGFRKITRQCLSDLLLTGNCFAGIEYATEKTKDPITGEYVSAYQGPRPYRISPRDIVFNPTAVSFEKSPKIVKKRVSLGELEKEMMTNPNLGYRPDAISSLKERRAAVRQAMEEDGSKAESFIPDGFGGSANYYTGGYVTLYEFYGDIYDDSEDKLYNNHVITVADGTIILRAEEMNTFSGHPHIYHAGWEDRPDNIWSMGPLDNLVSLQYRINHLENALADAFDDMLDPDRVFQGDVEELKTGASTTYIVGENGGVSYLAPDTTVLQGNFQIDQLESAMKMYANYPSESMGMRTPGEKTAFEVGMLNNNANRAFEYRAQNFSDFLAELVNAEIEIAIQNLNTSDIISVVDEDFGVEEFMSITREDLVSNGKLIPVGVREYSRKARLAQQLGTFYQTGMTDPEVAQHFPAKKVAQLWSELLDFENIFEPYGRIAERQEQQTLNNIAQNTVMERGMIDPSGDADMEV